jgi:hypothetical protein
MVLPDRFFIRCLSRREEDAAEMDENQKGRTITKFQVLMSFHPISPVLICRPPQLMPTAKVSPPSPELCVSRSWLVSNGSRAVM